MKKNFLNILKSHSSEISKKLNSGYSWEDIQEQLRMKCIKDCSWNADFDSYINDINIYFDIIKDLKNATSTVTK